MLLKEKLIEPEGQPSFVETRISDLACSSDVDFEERRPGRPVLRVGRGTGQGKVPAKKNDLFGNGTAFELVGSSNNGQPLYVTPEALGQDRGRSGGACHAPVGGADRPSFRTGVVRIISERVPAALAFGDNSRPTTRSPDDEQLVRRASCSLAPVCA